MPSIPVIAFKFGGLDLNNYPVSYSKSKVSRSTITSYILHPKGGCMPGQPEVFIKNGRSNPGLGSGLLANKVISAFKREKNQNSKKTFGPKYSELPLDNFNFESFHPHDDETRSIAIKAAYRQIYGNFHLMESERPIDLERRLRNGDINIREFIRGLMKSEFYRFHYCEVVSQTRLIELTLKHLLGRPPISQKEIVKHIEILNQEGFESYVDSLIDSQEYEDNFGAHVVPKSRCWDSQCGLRTSTFLNGSALARSFSTSDNAIHGRATLADAAGGKSQLVQSMAERNAIKVRFPEYIVF